MSILQPDWRFLRQHPAHMIALGLGSGLSPVAPGTAGTLMAIPLYAALAALLPPAGLWLVIALSLPFGVWACGVAGRHLGEIDHGSIVWDEIVAFWLVLACIPWRITPVVAAFVLFRLFDVWKPFPIGWLDRHIHTPLGVMLDDLLAAGYALAILEGGMRWLQ